ncbi:MFS transporter [Dactylosporangium sp. AC04546]|uniref:MFS transporter n=1 Tax=Dactylosporangium sp. AC04546 TaxID=2862460 RepID=UPI001EDFDFB7|nr:MFS transporter [Dactylosporangium sp. AC04546]WVK88687.1 MFS transporter [Dactylosporangium sp. AC04546]
MTDASRSAPRSAGGTLAVAAAGTALVLVAFTAPLATLPATAAAVHAGPGGQAWILSGMSVGCAAGLLGAGALGDDHGRRRTLLAGVLLLAAASLLGAAAPDALVLIVARILQGLGGAAILACSLGLIGHVYPDGPQRARATGIWGAALGAGVAAGPFLALGLQAVGGWRVLYVATALAALLLCVAGRVWLPASPPARRRPVDVAGTVLLGLGLAVVLAGLVQGRTGWTGPLTLGLFTAGLLLVAGFVVVEHRRADAMFDLTLLGRRDFTAALVAALAAGAGVLSLASFTPIIVERGLGGSALAGVAAMLAWSGLSALTPLAAGRLSRWITPRGQLVAGLLGCAAGQLALMGLHPHSPVARLLPGLLLAGAANGVLNAALGRQAVSSVPADRTAMGSGANNTARYLGSAIGLALVTVLISHGTTPPAVLAGWNHAVLATAACSLAGALIVLFTRDRATTVPGPARRRLEPAAQAS